MSINFSKKSLIVKLSILFIISIFIISFTACNNSNQTEVDTSVSDTDEVTNKKLTLATTTSVNDSGLMDYLTPIFEEETGYQLDVVSQGTGQAIQTGKDGNADILLIHAKAAEEEFVNEGYGLERVEIMYNYFVIVGPKDNPAQISDTNSAGEAFKSISENESKFVSRGDDSGTHKKELGLWESISIEPKGDWYIAAGRGMGDVLLMASEEQAYTITDKATYLSMKDKLDLEIIVGASDDLLNQYTVIEVNPDKHEGINKVGADAYLKWISSDKVLNLINKFGVEQYGEGLFTANYNPQ
ncbi:tungsten ABC transporter substrate-binding protein [Alkalibaculum sp. M08DMB]|uniref:Tungsten ABC transporter substrate-binding protein n=1 Tax=Alkalibaculum sporogenes TaxID=2655001 RepID=A0A6A7KBB6_9FIRM|nr:substrate-binding domain-containing protein [Alkalibaculum sporogenes]MPW26662.1 tungsten ABC transporter substrate-binding protein [Alkalibaculum sporogenes]